jgi:alkanesulfonate monooxygenase SsuD/methylene tetrahydromethanopterin reductase-like flavin-dependent oxidoreductase (luciferase family)
VNLGVTLPTFAPDAAAVLEAARAAEAAGLQGVFGFDHQFPLGHPGRPALSVFPVLGAVAAVTTRIRVGTLVARIGLLPDEVVVESLRSLQLMLGDRLVAGLGIGDEQSRPEHVAYGLPYMGTAARIERLGRVLDRLRASGIECWVGGGSATVSRVAAEHGAALNLWGAPAERVAAEGKRHPIPVTWGGPMAELPDAAAAELVALRQAGATWAVWAWPRSLAVVEEAAALAGVPLVEPQG